MYQSQSQRRVAAHSYRRVSLKMQLQQAWEFLRQAPARTKTLLHRQSLIWRRRQS
jgi:hypothetical protein